MKNIFKLCLISILIFLTGCSLLSPVKQKPVTSYLIKDPIAEAKTSPAKSHRVLLVSTVTTVPWLNTTKMAYQTTSQQIGYFAQSQWISPPNTLIQPIIVHALLNSRNYLAVVSPPYYGVYNQRLDIQVLKFQQIFTQEPSYYQVTLQARLLNAGTQRLIAEKRFTATVPAPYDNPEGGVTAANQAIQLLLPQLVRFSIAH